MKFFTKPNFKIAGISATVFVIMASIIAGIGYWYFNDLFAGAYDCHGKNIGVVRLFGQIDTLGTDDGSTISGPRIAEQIDALDKDKKIKGIILDIDSPGGTGVAGETIMNALQRATKPVAALIRSSGDSAAYLAATGADRIFASKISEVGSIGIAMSFLDTSEKDQKEGVKYYDLSSGPNKAAGAEHSTLTPGQKAVIDEEINKMHNIFVEYVAKNRNLTIEKVKSLADGRAYLGDDAKALGLIDEVGGMEEVKQWLKNQTKTEPELCTLP